MRSSVEVGPTGDDLWARVSKSGRTYTAYQHLWPPCEQRLTSNLEVLDSLRVGAHAGCSLRRCS